MVNKRDAMRQSSMSANKVNAMTKAKAAKNRAGAMGEMEDEMMRKRATEAYDKAMPGKAAGGAVKTYAKGGPVGKRGWGKARCK
jgi:hypothetical protein